MCPRKKNTFNNQNKTVAKKLARPRHNVLNFWGGGAGCINTIEWGRGFVYLFQSRLVQQTSRTKQYPLKSTEEYKLTRAELNKDGNIFAS